MASTVGTLIINIEAGLAQLKKDVAEAKGIVQTNLEGMSKAADMAKLALGALAGAWAVQELKSWVTASFEAIDANAKMADRLGITTESLSGMTLAAQLAGVSQETLATGMRGLQKNIYLAAEGAKQQEQALKQLHLTTEQLFALRPDQQLSKVVDSLSKVENTTQRNAIAMQLFGSRASEMLNLVSEGSEGIRKATADAEAWGLALNRVDSAKVELAHDAVIRAEGALRGIANTIAVQLSPIIKGLADSFSDTAAKSHGFRDEVVTGFSTIVHYIGYVADAVHALHLGFLVIEDAFMGVSQDIVAGLAWIDRTFTDLYNKLAASYIGKKLGLPIMEYTASLQTAAVEGAKAVAQLDDEVVKLASEPWPHEKIDAWVKDVQQKTQQAAEKIAADRAKLLTPSAPVSTRDYDKDLENYQHALFKRTAALRESMRTQHQVEQDAYNQQRADLLAAMQQGLLDQDVGHKELETLEQDHQARMWGLKRAYHQLDLESTDAFLGNITNLMQSHSKTQFEIGKAASIAQTIIKTYESAQSAYAAMAGIPIIGPALGAAAAIAAVTFGLAQVSKIQSTSFGGGAGGGSGGGVAVPTVASNPSTRLPIGTPGGNVGATTPATPPRVVNVYLPTDGAPLSQDYVRNQLLPALNDAYGDGAGGAVLQVH